MAYVGMDYFTQGPYQGLPDVFTTYQKYLNDAGTTNPGITGINTNLMYPYGQGGGDGGNPGTGFGRYGNLDPTSKKTIDRSTWGYVGDGSELVTDFDQGTYGFTSNPTDIYQDELGNWKTYEGANAYSLFNTRQPPGVLSLFTNKWDYPGGIKRGSGQGFFSQRDQAQKEHIEKIKKAQALAIQQKEERKRQEQLRSQVTAQANREARERVAGGEAPDYGHTETRSSSGWESSPFAQGGIVAL